MQIYFASPIFFHCDMKSWQNGLFIDVSFKLLSRSRYTVTLIGSICNFDKHDETAYLQYIWVYLTYFLFMKKTGALGKTLRNYLFNI